MLSVALQTATHKHRSTLMWRLVFKYKVLTFRLLHPKITCWLRNNDPLTHTQIYAAV